MKIWDKFTGPIDQDSVKLEFFRKIHRKNPPFRIKVPLPPKNTVIVPEMVRYHYRKPVNLLPKLRDVLRLECVNKKRNDDCEIVEEVKIEDIEDCVEESVKAEQENDRNNVDSDSNCDIVKSNQKTSKRHEYLNLEGSSNSFSDGVEWSPVNGYVKNEHLNGGYFEKELIKKEHSFISDMISGMTVEST